MSGGTETPRRFLVAASASLAFVLPVAAHHGWGGFDVAKPLDHSGTVSESGYANPHGVLKTMREGKELTFELAPVARMESRGLTAADIAPGKTVRLFGYQNNGVPTLYRAEWIEIAGRRIELR